MYTQIYGGDEIIEEYIAKIKKKAKGNVYLYGSYGKGEGGIRHGRPVNDFDLFTDGDFQMKEIDGIHVDIAQFDGPITQEKYEMVYGSIPIKGEIHLPKIEPYDIPYEDAIDSLDRRVTSMLIAKYEMGKEKGSDFKVMTQISKMIIALGDAVLIKRGEFNVSYRTRNFMLQDDDIGGLYALAVRHKVLCDLQFDKDGLWQLWHEIRLRFREYTTKNHIVTPRGELLFNVDDRTERDTLKKVIVELGAGDWI